MITALRRWLSDVDPALADTEPARTHVHVTPTHRLRVARHRGRPPVWTWEVVDSRDGEILACATAPDQPAALHAGWQVLSHIALTDYADSLRAQLDGAA